VPWSHSLEKQLGRHVSGVARNDGGIDWSFSRKWRLGLRGVFQNRRSGAPFGM
jgi:hypothetical protein